MAKLHQFSLLLLLCACATLQSSSSLSDHLYNVGDIVPFFVNKLGPFNNPRSVPSFTIDQVESFKEAINRDFYFQFYLDDLPFWGFTGKLEENRWTPGGGGPNYYLFTHVQFDVLYNGNRVIEVNAFGDPNQAVNITKDVDIDVKFTYSVLWNTPELPFENRMDRYSRASLTPVYRKVHWFSLINSIVIILLLIGLIALLYNAFEE